MSVDTDEQEALENAASRLARDILRAPIYSVPFGTMTEIDSNDIPETNDNDILKIIDESLLSLIRQVVKKGKPELTITMHKSEHAIVIHAVLKHI